jgi:hypothetical protein
MIAHGVSRGLKREREPAPEGRKIPGGLGSVAPLGLGIHTARQPTAHAVGYHLSALRAWDGRGVIRGVWIGRARGAEHRQTIAHGVSRGLKREREPAPEGRKIPGLPAPLQSKR